MALPGQTAYHGVIQQEEQAEQQGQRNQNHNQPDRHPEPALLPPRGRTWPPLGPGIHLVFILLFNNPPGSLTGGRGGVQAADQLLDMLRPSGAVGNQALHNRLGHVPGDPGIQLNRGNQSAPVRRPGVGPIRHGAGECLIKHRADCINVCPLPMAGALLILLRSGIAREQL